MSEIELIISANGCIDNTKEYLEELKDTFKSQGLENHLKVIWSDIGLGYSKATNAGIRAATTENIVLLNNDTVLLPQETNTWLRIMEDRFLQDPKCKISGVHALHSNITQRVFIIFFCVMIRRDLFDKIGFLNEEYGIGAGEDTEFCFEAERAGYTIAYPDDNSPSSEFYVGSFPIYHVGEGTVHDENLVKNWDNVIFENESTLARKYNVELYQNNYEGKPKPIMPVKLHLACGLDYLEGYINVDLYPQEGAKVDEVFDVRKIPYPDNSVDEIRAFHIIEHFDWKEGQRTLEEWYRVLKPGGRLWLETPDFLASCDAFVKADNNFKNYLYGHFFATPWIPGQTHKFLFTEEQLKIQLTWARFKTINRLPPSSNYITPGLEFLFLNVEAFK